ncbi:MAG: thrombospondin type 3 repeat-containing protein, partial [Bradymonadaceae bacterium]
MSERHTPQTNRTSETSQLESIPGTFGGRNLDLAEALSEAITHLERRAGGTAVLVMTAAIAVAGCGVEATGDGVPGGENNCPDTNNVDRQDGGGDGTGANCDEDRDDDGIPNGGDNCPDTYNPDETDTDDDGSGDRCDADNDGDGSHRQRRSRRLDSETGDQKLDDPQYLPAQSADDG